MKDIRVNDLVLVCGKLKTIITRIEGDKYFFMDGDKEWCEVKEAIEVIESVRQINSKTNCPTCGSEVTIGGEGPTHFYIPKVKYEWIDIERAYLIGLIGKNLSIDELSEQMKTAKDNLLSLKNWFETNLKKP